MAESETENRKGKKTEEKSKRKNPASPSPIVQHSHTTPSSHSEKNVTKADETSIAPEGTIDSNPIPVVITEDNSNSPPSPSPLMKISVKDNATTVLIGDSFIKGVNLSKSFPPHAVTQKISVSGLRASDLTEWLRHQPQSRKVKDITIHVGVNDCKDPVSFDDGISTEQWKELLSTCQSVFPAAAIHTSSIIPGYGRHPCNPAIYKSNKNLKQACDSIGATYTDHTSVFTTPKGAPRVALYADHIHPTKKGTARFAENLFGPQQHDEHPQQPSQTPGGWVQRQQWGQARSTNQLQHPTSQTRGQQQNTNNGSTTQHHQQFFSFNNSAAPSHQESKQHNLSPRLDYVQQHYEENFPPLQHPQNQKKYSYQRFHDNHSKDRPCLQHPAESVHGPPAPPQNLMSVRNNAFQAAEHDPNHPPLFHNRSGSKPRPTADYFPDDYENSNFSRQGHRPGQFQNQRATSAGYGYHHPCHSYGWERNPHPFPPPAHLVYPSYYPPQQFYHHPPHHLPPCQ